MKNAGDQLGLNVEVKSIENPRKEKEEHYYNAAHSGLLDLGLKPNLMTDEVLGELLEHIVEKKDRIAERRILPRVSWS